MNIRRLAIFASGSGTNAQRIIEYFSDIHDVKVECLLSNTPKAYALTRAALLGVETLVFSKAQFYQSGSVTDYLLEKQIDLVVLAGFLWLVPPEIVNRFQVLNIHPALLPHYGGKNMYGHHVHQAVIENGESQSGITIHFVNEKYDEGKIVFQARCPVVPGDTPDSLAARIHELEYGHYPRIIEEVARNLAPRV